jgi:hypothetical protein
MSQQNIEKPYTSSLETVAQQFEKWRATRVKREKIPNELWALTAPLMNQYGRSKIAATLRVNYAQLKENTLPLLPNDQQKPVRFIECPLPTIPTSSVENCIVEITGKNGSTVKITGLASMQIRSLVSSLIGNGL